MGMGEVDRAMTEYARAIELDADILNESESGISARVSTPEQRARVNFLIAKAYAKRGNLDGALEYLQRAKDGRFPEMGRVYKDRICASLDGPAAGKDREAVSKSATALHQASLCYQAWRGLHYVGNH